MFLPQWLMETPLARRLLECFFQSQARRRLVELDHQSIARCQSRILRGLVRRAQATRFGREHDFHRIRTAEDFRRLVPLRDLAELWAAYGQSASPHRAGVSRPGLNGSPSGSSATMESVLGIPLSSALQAVHENAMLTALAFVWNARPRAGLLSGRMLLLDTGRDGTPVPDRRPTEGLATPARRQFSSALRPFVVVPPGHEVVPGASSEEEFRAFAQRSAALPVTCVAGAADEITRLFTCLQQVTREDRVAKIWPGLAAVLYDHGSADARARLAGDLGSPGILLLEVCFRPEGPIAVEDPQYGMLRLLPDHGVYFEFVPADQLGQPQPARLGAAEVEPGVPYALALTSPAGLWACLTGLVVMFAQRQPPLLRLLETGTPQAAPPAATVAARSTAHPFPVQPPHPRSGGSPATLPERPVRSASSAPGDRE